MNRDALRDMLITDEGFRAKPYKCTAGKLTIGYGTNIEDGITEHEALCLLNIRMEKCIEDMNKVFKDYFLFPESIQLAFANMRYNLGSGGFRGFKKMIAAAKEMKWNQVSIEMMDSDWYNQVGDRAKKLVNMVKAVA